MSYSDELVKLLKPLGVYSFAEGSFSLAELQALGSALDKLEKELVAEQKETIPETAIEDGLQKFEKLFPYKAPTTSNTERRRSIRGFWQIGGDSFTPSIIRSCLSACGVVCAVEESGANCVKITFPDTMGEPQGFEKMKQIIEAILPCQLGITYAFTYCTWNDTKRYGLSWNDVGKMTWKGWSCYKPAET